MTAPDILAAVNAAGGRPVKLGSIRNTLVGLATAGTITRPPGTVGMYAPAQ